MSKCQIYHSEGHDINILHITPDLNFMVKFVLPIAEAQSLAGNHLSLVTSNYEYKAAHDVLKSSFLDKSRFEIFFLKIKIAEFGLAVVKDLIKLCELLMRKKYDLVVCHTSVDSFVPILLARLFSDSRVIYFNHGIPALGYSFPVNIPFYFVEAVNIIASHAVVTIGFSMANSLKKFGMGFKSVTYVKPGSASGVKLIFKSYSELMKARTEAKIKLGLDPSSFVILYVGRATKRKGLYDLLLSLQIVRGNPKVFIVGPAREEIDNIKKYQDHDVEVVGYQASIDLYYLASDLLCIPSYHEGFGCCYLEAASLGCVPICSDIPGPTDFVVNEVNGLTVRPGSKKSIADAINMLHDDKFLRKKLAIEAFNSSKKFERRAIASSVSKMLNNMLKLP